MHNLPAGLEGKDDTEKEDAEEEEEAHYLRTCMP
jgi:hypothetical protein